MATLLGPARVLRRELDGAACRTIDLQLSELDASSAAMNAAADRLVRELMAAPRPDAAEMKVALRGADRWVESDEPVTLPNCDATAAFPRPGATYLITGGLGDLGLELAERMARQAKVQLVLLARAQLPPRERWKNIASGDGGTTEERRRIRKLLAIESGGSAVLPVAADVTQLESVRAGVAEATRRFGRIHGVIHAAGAVDDGPMALKTDASIARVVGPKLLGLICLEEVLRSSPPELLVLFSSTSSFLGLPGQADYAAANAFLNAYARSGARLTQRTVAIQWGAWGSVGMAARAAGVVPPEPGGDGDEVSPDAFHPLLGKVLRRGAGGALFEAQYAPSTHWVLDEHRLSTGEPIIPGTGYIEMARAAFAETFGPGPIEIRDLVFLAPLSGKDSPRRVRIELRAEGDGYAFSVASESDRGWVENARASIARASSAPPAALDLERLSAMCSSRSERFASDGKPTRQERYLRFGPRWKTLQETRYGDRKALGVLELQAGFESDLASYSVHPAMLDLATACGFPLLRGYEQSDGLYVPFSYRAVRIHGPLPRRCWSHVRASGDSDASSETAAFDVTICGPDGRVLVECDEFLVRRVDPSVIAGGATTDKAPSRSAASAPGAPRNGDGAGGSFLEEIVRTGILPDEGWEAIRRIVNGPPIPEVIVSPVALDLLRRRVEAAFGRRRAPAAPRAGAASGAATSDPTQATLAKMWEDLLGVNGVGADDDFFELGGHSLIAVRLLARIEKTFHKKLKLATLFEARTLRALADLLREGSPQTQQPAKWKSLVPIQGTGSSPTLFCVHGVGGEVLNFAALAARLGPEQPFIALRAPSHDGSSEPLRTVEQQAELYVKEITEYQPQGPYLLSGYSYGGLVALAMARLLAASGRRVSFLGVIDTWHKDSFVPSRGGVLAWLRNARRWLVLDAWEPAKAAGVSPWRAAVRAVRTSSSGAGGPAEALSSGRICRGCLRTRGLRISKSQCAARWQPTSRLSRRMSRSPTKDRSRSSGPSRSRSSDATRRTWAGDRSRRAESGSSRFQGPTQAVSRSLASKLWRCVSPKLSRRQPLRSGPRPTPSSPSRARRIASAARRCRSDSPSCAAYAALSRRHERAPGAVGRSVNDLVQRGPQLRAELQHTLFPQEVMVRAGHVDYLDLAEDVLPPAQVFVDVEGFHGGAEKHQVARVRLGVVELQGLVETEG
jgi:NAD(P)-dependent dehydrogenase (short-subunit alcohol dehydrogenase family)/pimeloyl-ACP methyl ester carboxylesterase